MKELKVSLVTENITDEQLDKLDEFINKVFYSPVMVITTRELDLLKEKTNEKWRWNKRKNRKNKTTTRK